MPHATEVAIGSELAPQAAVTAGTASDVITVDFGDLATDMTAVTSSDVDTQSTANSAIDLLDTAIEKVNKQRATFGSAANRLEHAVDNMTSIRNAAEASRSRIEDTDYAETTSELAKAQIIQQAGTAMLAQANQLPQSVLSLLK
jgi:flagellin